MLELQPIDFSEAREFIRLHHRHHKPPVGHKFSIAVNDGQSIVGVVIVGRPVARMLQDGFTLEVTRLCTIDNSPKNVCSMLYAAAWRAARAMGYKRLITYVLASERGTSVRSAGWKELGVCGGGSWSRVSRPRIDTHPTEQKTLWEIAL